MLDWNDYFRMTIGLIAIVGPVGSIPFFLDFTDNVQSQRPRIARTAGLAVACILTVSVLGGSQLLYLFNISIDGFRVAGGLLLLTIAFQMLEARTSRMKNTPEESQEAIDSTHVGVVPLGRRQKDRKDRRMERKTEGGRQKRKTDKRQKDTH